ncbi:protein kinase domain-containing protein [Streptomyces vilmorinianum]|uniref:protein kinase domain-containing protein n=1 Tax=Streptomyces vilmorinianum TaxID=3051092 RepID=UPI001C306C7D|nr:FHA domain-containing serine/threonine-protein kinase [Streptomyces vilmorinianum]
MTITVHTPDAVEEYVYDEPAGCDVGRSAACGIRIPDRYRRVSRRHCRLDVDPPGVRVRDLGSSYGTHVNGSRLGRLTEQPLTDGDEIAIGDVRLRITVETTADGPEEAREAPPVPGYVLVRELGRGSQGVVHLARHRATGELVALKRVAAQGPVDAQARFAFRREFASVRALRHPNIVAFLDTGDTGDTGDSGDSTAGADRAEGGDAFWFACELCPGGTLERLAARHAGRVPVPVALSVVRQVLAGLDHAHRAELPATRLADGAEATARGLVHRDVKPANILLTGEESAAGPVVKLADFGLAKAFEHAGLSGHTRTGALGGTIPFVPRSQLLDYKYAGPEVDVWAAAACLYWMLTGATPRDFPAHKDPVAIALREPVVRIGDRGASIPPRLADVVDAALVDTPRIQVRTAAELARALREST